MREKNVATAKKNYKLDELGCLLNFYEWDPDFAEAMAGEVGITAPLTEEHMKILLYLREVFALFGKTPIVHKTCRDNGLKLFELEKLFPAGYHRCACKLAGLNYFDRPSERIVEAPREYRINSNGFLVDPEEWDEDFAEMRANELSTTLTERHWEIIRFIRETYFSTGKVPTVFEVSHGCEIEGEELETLFPTGYQRGAVKIAGLALAK